MISEREYNRGAPELECEAYIEWAPYPNWPTIETIFDVVYENDGGIRVHGAYLKDDENDHALYPSFTDDQKAQVESECIDDYVYRCDQAQAMAEDAAASRAEAAMEARHDL